jgi:hypothetical protein
MTDKTTASRDDEGGGYGLAVLLGLGGLAVFAAGYAGYQIAVARMKLGLGARPGMPCAGCADKAAREAAEASAEAQADYQEEAAAAAGLVNGSGPADVIVTAGDAANG